MIDFSRRLLLPDLPHVEIYRDSEQTDTYYVVPWAPALATDDRNRPAASLAIYVRREGTRKIAAGGLLTLTSTLAVAVDDLSRIRSAIVAVRAGGAPETIPADGVGTVHLAVPDWLSGTVTIEVIPSLTLTGQPALFGDNSCVVTMPLDVAQSSALRDEWNRGLPAARISYVMMVRGATEASTRTRVRAHTIDASGGRMTDRSAEMTGDVREVSTGTQTIAVSGPLWTPALADLINEIDIS
jgi:hypothetical protein